MMNSRLGVEELARLPVELGRHVDAAVQIGDDAAVEAQREGARRLAEVEDVEEHRLTLLRQLVRGADPLRREGRRRSGIEAVIAAPARRCRRPWPRPPERRRRAKSPATPNTIFSGTTYLRNAALTSSRVICARSASSSAK